MNRTFIIFIIGALLLASLFFACNKTEEEITIVADVPAIVSLNGAVPDTFKFQIKARETTLDSIQLFEGNINYVKIPESIIGADSTKFNFSLLYRPVSIGIKDFELRVMSDVYSKSYFFSVEVIE